MTVDEFEKSYMRRLTPAQKDACKAIEGPILLLAVPGSGKTTVLITRLGYMVLCAGIRPENILTVTYTDAATGEMRERCQTLFGEKMTAGIEFRTINGICAKLVYRYIRQYGKREPRLLSDEGERLKIIRQCYVETEKEYPDENTLKGIATLISFAKNMLMSDDEIEETLNDPACFPAVYRRYREILRAGSLMDYDDQLCFALRILQKTPELLAAFQEKYRYICVDEAQDTSKVQHEVIKLLASKYQNLFMVGDEDQSIYGFRAAYPDALLHFESDHPGARVLLMEDNFRSTGAITEIANLFIRQNKSRHPKVIRAHRGAGLPIRRIETLGRRYPYDYLAALADGCSTETAVLFRNNDSALPLLDLLERRGIPYRYRKADIAFFSHRITTDVTDFIRLAYDPHDKEAFLRIYYKTGLYVRRELAEAAISSDQQNPCGLFQALLRVIPLTARAQAKEVVEAMEAIPHVGAAEAMELISERIGYRDYLFHSHSDTAKLDILSILASREPDAEHFLSRLGTLRDKINSGDFSPDTRFILSTVHSSKGLEYDRVFLLDVYDRILPSLTPVMLDSEADEAIYEEERRIFYVAMTRAKNELFYFSCPDIPSTFVQELNAALPSRRFENNSVFAFANAGFLGKYYHNGTRNGRIVLQNDDDLLVDYGNSTERLTFTDMWKNRAFSEEEAPKAKPEKPLLGSFPEDAPRPVGRNTSFHVGQLVRHTHFGVGTVEKLDDRLITINFPDGGRRTFDQLLVKGKGLLTVVSPSGSNR